MNKLKRYILFLIGLFVNALGVSPVTKASLGTSPISSIPYVLSLNFPFTLGNFTIVFSILLIVLQILILRKNFKLENILQIPVSIAFGYFIDLTMYMLFWINPQSYFVKMIALLAGCLGTGIWCLSRKCWQMLSCCRENLLSGRSYRHGIPILEQRRLSLIRRWRSLQGFFFFCIFRKIKWSPGRYDHCSIAGWIYCRLLGKRLEFIKSYLFPEENGEGGQALASAADAENAENAPVADGITGKLAEKQEAEGDYQANQYEKRTFRFPYEYQYEKAEQRNRRNTDPQRRMAAGNIDINTYEGVAQAEVAEEMTLRHMVIGKPVPQSRSSTAARPSVVSSCSFNHLV